MNFLQYVCLKRFLFFVELLGLFSLKNNDEKSLLAVEFAQKEPSLFLLQQCKEFVVTYL